MSARVEELFSVEGRTALVTGASGYLGRTITAALLENGANVIALGRSERLEEHAAQWRAEHGEERVLADRVDMYDLDALARTLDRLAQGPTVDVLVNNAHELGPETGFNTEAGTLENTTPDQLLRNLTGGVVWATLTTQKLGEGMKAQGRGSIVNVSTMYAAVAPDPRLYEGMAFANPPGYGAAKAGMIALTRYTASFWGTHGIRANAILPGPFSNTEGDTPNAVGPDDRFLDRLRDRTVLGRIGAPRELLGAVMFLASDASSYVTGQALVVDGGWTIT